MNQEVTQSLEIPEENFGHTYRALMIPPFPMRTILHLGWESGKIAHLIDKIWPVGTEHTACDVREPEGGYEPQMFWKSQAWEFVQNSGKAYDYVIIDLYKGKRIPDFVFSEKFVEDLSRIVGKMLAINCTFYKFDDYSMYGKHFDFDVSKRVGDDKVLFMVPKRLQVA